MILTDNIFVTCPRGLEESLSYEITAILGKNPSIDSGGVYVKGGLDYIYKLKLETRTSMLVLK